MRRALPSIVVTIIEEQFSWTRGDWRQRVEERAHSMHYAVTALLGIVRLIERIPEEVLLLDPAIDAQFTMALTALEAAITKGQSNPNAFDWPRIVVSTKSDPEDCLVIVKNALATCPDQAPSQSMKGLEFLADNFRRSLLTDLRSAEICMNIGEWKASTVLSGSVIEALLLWAIGNRNEAERSSAMDRAVTKRVLSTRLQVKNLTEKEWGLHSYIEIAHELGEITEPTAHSCRNAKFYRNLIHPGAAERCADKTNRPYSSRHCV